MSRDSEFTEDGRFDPFGDLEDDGDEDVYGGDRSRSYGDGLDDEEDQS